MKFPLTAAVTLSIVATIVPDHVRGQAYLGASYGKSEAGCARYERGTACGRDRSTGWQVFGGYDFNDYFAIDAAYVEHATFGLGFSAQPGFSPDGRATSIAAKGAIPVNDHISLYAKAGFARWEFVGETFGIGPQRETKGTDRIIGIGLEYIVDVLGLRLQWDRTEFGQVDVDSVSAGIVVKF